MTTQRQLAELAQKHASNPAVSVLLLSLKEGGLNAKAALARTEVASVTLRMASELQDGYSLPLDNSEFVTAAAKASAALSRMAYDLANLACILHALGEDVSY